MTQTIEGTVVNNTNAAATKSSNWFSDSIKGMVDYLAPKVESISKPLVVETHKLAKQHPYATLALNPTQFRRRLANDAYDAVFGTEVDVNKL
jgi:hypothetical protein